MLPEPRVRAQGQETAAIADEATRSHGGQRGRLRRPVALSAGLPLEKAVPSVDEDRSLLSGETGLVEGVQRERMGLRPTNIFVGGKAPNTFSILSAFG